MDVSRLACGGDGYLGEAGGLLTPAQRALVRRCAGLLAWLGPRVPAVASHGDFQPRNWIWDPGSGLLGVIDWERAEPAAVVRDLARLEYGPWDRRPDLREQFFAGYGRALTITVEEARDVFARLTELREIHDWRPAVRLTPWTAETEGHMIVVEPDGTANAWPVYDQPDLFLRLGNLLEEPVSGIWQRYPYKASHYAKYLGASIHAAPRSAR